MTTITTPSERVADVVNFIARQPQFAESKQALDAFAATFRMAQSFDSVRICAQAALINAEDPTFRVVVRAAERACLTDDIDALYNAVQAPAADAEADAQIPGQLSLFDREDY